MTERFAESDTVGIGADVFKKEANVFPRLPLRRKVVDELCHGFSSDQLEKQLKRGPPLGNLVHTVAQPKHSRRLVDHDLSLASGSRNGLDAVDERARRIHVWKRG